MGRWSCFRPVTLESPPVSHAKLVCHFCAVRVASPRAMASSDMLRVLALCSAQDEPCRLLALPEPVLQLVLDSMPGNEALAIGVSCRALHEAVQRMQGMHARVWLLASRGRISFSTGSNTKNPAKACRARSFQRFLERGGIDMLASLTIRVQPAPETLFREFVGTQLYHPVSARLWAPLAALQRLTIDVDDGNVGDTFSDILSGCSGLTSLRMKLPGHWDTKFLFRQSSIAGLKHLRELSIETQRLSFHCPFGAAPAAGQGFGAPADQPSLPRLQLVAQELAVYGGAAPVTSGVQSMELVASRLHYADGQALQRLLDGGCSGLTMRLAPGALRPFAKRQNVSAAALAEEQALAEAVLAFCEPEPEHAPAVAA